MTQPPVLDSGAIVAFFNAVSLIVVAFFQYKTKKDVSDTKRDVTEVKQDTKEQTEVINQTKSTVDSVQQLANGRLTEALHQVELLKVENEKLKAELGHRRSTDI